MRFIINPIVLSLAVLCSPTAPLTAHPGRTDSSGGHTCRTNCPKWGLGYGEYHRHGGGRSAAPRARREPAATPDPPRRRQAIEPLATGLAEIKVRVRVLEVVDGDTLIARLGGRQRPLHLVDVDAPELDQPEGQPARRTVASWVLDRDVEVVVVDDDGAGGKWVRVFLDDGRRLARELLAEGLAWRRPGHGLNWRAVEETAREGGKGLWRHPRPMAPWTWRERAADPGGRH